MLILPHCVVLMTAIDMRGGLGAAIKAKCPRISEAKGSSQSLARSCWGKLRLREEGAENLAPPSPARFSLHALPW